MTKRIGYAKLGRAMTIDPSRYGFQGDAEAPQLLRRLSERNPDVTWVLVGRNRGDVDMGIPRVENPWEGSWRKSAERAKEVEKLIPDLDGIVVHVGQHAPLHQPVPRSHNTWAEFEIDPVNNGAKPYDWAYGYGAYLLRGMAGLGDRTDGKAPVVWLVPDPRNYIKARDIKWPTGMDAILAQYQYDKKQRHERFRDPRLPEELGFGDWCYADCENEKWVATHSYRYGGLELMILPDDWETWGPAEFNDRLPVGVATTSFHVGKPRRSEIVRDVVLSTFPTAEVYGKWDKASLADVPEGTVIENSPTEFADLLNRWRVTIATPTIGSSWTVAKTYQCFAARVACLMYSKVDDQGWTLPSRREEDGTKFVGSYGRHRFFSVRDDWTDDDLALAAWLRVETAEEFAKKAATIAGDAGIWQWVTDQQRSLLRRRWDAHYVERCIEYRLGIGS